MYLSNIYPKCNKKVLPLLIRTKGKASLDAKVQYPNFILKSVEVWPKYQCHILAPNST